MKLAIASIFDPYSPSSWSGCSQYLLRALERDHGVSIAALGPFEYRTTIADRLRTRYHRLRGRNHLPLVMPAALRDFARRTEARLAEVPCDAVLALDAHTIAMIETDKPIFYFWDCTFAGNLEYPWFAALAPSSIAAGHAMERGAIAHARMAFYSSNWAVASAIEDYGADPARTRVVPLAANIDCDRTAADVERLIAARPTDEFHLLFLGVDWRRKGGDLALAVAAELNRRGIRAVLHVAGCAPEVAGPLPEYLRAHGFLDKRVPADLERLTALIAEAHFLIVPSLAESFGAVFAEASSFGVPSLARRIGGIDSAVHQEINGLLFDRDAGPAPYADAVAALWADPERYRALARSSFRLFTERLTWTHSAATLLSHIKEGLRRG